jgi:asparagine N-glycosylation enzyme membrane subunit Stt3
MRERRFWSLVSSYSLGALPVGAITYLTPLYLSRAFGLTPAQLGYVLWIPPAGLEAGYFFWGWVSDRFERASPRPVWLFLLMSLLMFPLAAVHFFNSAPAAIALLTFGLFAAGGLVVVTLRTGALAYPADQRSMAAGISSASFFSRGRRDAADLRVSIRPPPLHPGVYPGRVAADHRDHNLVVAAGHPKRSRHLVIWVIWSLRLIDWPMQRLDDR